MIQHRRAASLDQDSAVHLHPQDCGQSCILDAGLRGALSLSQGGGLMLHFSPSYNAVIAAIP